MKKIINFFVLFFVCLIFANKLEAKTSISSNIIPDVWDVENSPYIIESTIEIKKNAKLIIEPGVEVRIKKGGKIIVNGELVAVGEENNKIVFTSDQTSKVKGDWMGIYFSSESMDPKFNEDGEYLEGSILRYTEVAYGQGIICDNASPYLERNIIFNNEIGISIIGTTTLALGEENDEINKIFISKNEIKENDIGIFVNRDNKNVYTYTPAGKILSGEFLETSIIVDNIIRSNNQGIVINNGDNNVILENIVRYNLNYGIRLSGISKNNLIEKNYVTNNDVGIIIESPDNKIFQNDIVGNSFYGISVNSVDNLVRNNNIKDNLEANLYNAIKALDVTYNYWGFNKEKEVVDTFIISESGNKINYNPFFTEEIDVTKVLDPIMQEIVTSTILEKQFLVGTKSANSAIFLNDEKIVDYNNETDWSYECDLEVGENAFKIYSVHKDGQKSSDLIFQIFRNEVPSKPIVETFTTTTEEKIIEISGQKDKGTEIWINDKKIIDINQFDTWNTKLELKKLGRNEFNIYAKNNKNIRSVVLNIVINRGEIDPETIIEEEIKLLQDINQELSEKLSGKILLQVEKNGYAWYLYPKDLRRYYLGRPAYALEVMKKLGLGIKHEELSNYLKNKFPERLSGFIMLDVEENGEAYYVDPKDLKGYYLGRPKTALEIMKKLSLGINNENIYKINIGKIESDD